MTGHNVCHCVPGAGDANVQMDDSESIYEDKKANLC